ncbi:MAG TPA: MFS transporter [Actinophytocola sp.]|nr:MFS transporter [Actinophytocola sp.]
MTAVTAPPQADAPRRRGGLLRDHDFRMLWAGETTSRLGSGITAVALPLVAVGVLGAGPIAMGILGAAAWLPWLLIGLPAGAWVDRLPRRAVMLTCDLICATTLVLVPVAAWLGMLSVGLLVGAAIVLGSCAVFFATAYQAYIPFLLPRDDLAEGNAKLQGSEQVANLAGPGAGGLIAQLFGALTGLFADALTFLTSALCLSRIRKREPRRDRTAEKKDLRKEIGEGLRYVTRDPYLRILALAASVDNLILNGYMALLVLFLVREVEVPLGAVGLLITADAIGGLLGAMVATRIARRLGTARAMLVCSLVATPFGLLVPLTGNGFGLLFFVAGMLVPAAGMVVGNVVVNGFRQAYCPPELLGRMFTSSRFIQFGVMPLGALLGGVLGATIGLRPALWVLFAAAVLGKCVRLIGPIRTNRDFPTEPSPER